MEHIKPFKFNSGKLYYVDELKISDKFNFEKELKIIEDEYESPDTLYSCFLIPKNPKHLEKLIFEVQDSDEFYAFNFAGFLHPENQLLGKFKYSIDSKFEDDHFEGIYKKISENRLIVFGKLTAEQNRINFICAVFENKRR
jgi:hypothetical protein